MKLGLVTYAIAREWTVDEIIERCSRLGYEGAELRTTHKHGVEPSLSLQERAEVKRKFQDSPIELVGLGSCCEFHSPEPAELKQNIETAKAFVILAKDVGAKGVKVRPNAFPADVSKEKTMEQIGLSLKEVSSFASDYGIRIRLEVHGRDTSYPPYIRKMVDIADNGNLYICWNSNMLDIDETGSIEKHFHMLRDKIEICHINELSSEYPWISLFSLLQKTKYEGFCMAEVLDSKETERYLKNYRALFCAFNRIAETCLQAGRQ
ncbi:MAG TPA: sugar phosphate isomerase/epimerase [bacterium]|nr:sugar phosphate isomerase/epimerase [bacterium]